MQSNSFDIIHMQEVAGGMLAHDSQQCFAEVADALSSYRGVRVGNVEDSHNPNNYRGNATFYQNTFVLRDYEVVWLKPQLILDDPASHKPEEEPRSVLHLTLKSPQGVVFHALNTHFAWGKTPEDADYKTEQAWKLDRVLDSLQHPFFLTGDFNMTSDTRVIQRLSEATQNLTSRYGVTNTLNPATHYAKNIFPAGLAVDYIFASKEWKVDAFHVVDTPVLSDHFGLRSDIALV